MVNSLKIRMSKKATLYIGRVLIDGFQIKGIFCKTSFMKRLLWYFLITLKSKLTKQEQFSSYTQINILSGKGQEGKKQIHLRR